MRLARLSFVLLALVFLGSPHGAEAFDADAAFPRGGYVLSLEGVYGEQFNPWHETITGLDFFNVGVRFGFLPWGAVGSGAFKGAFEIGLEPIYQRFIEPETAFFAGLGAVARSGLHGSERERAANQFRLPAVRRGRRIAFRHGKDRALRRLPAATYLERRKFHAQPGDQFAHGRRRGVVLFPLSIASTAPLDTTRATQYVPPTREVPHDPSRVRISRPRIAR
jgi:hypothetical protein